MKRRTSGKSGDEEGSSSPSCNTENPKRTKHTILDKTGAKTGNSTDATLHYNINPPRLSFDLPALSDIPGGCSKDWNDVELPVDILLLTVENSEFLACFHYLDKPFKSYHNDIGYVCFGSMSNENEMKLEIALMKCSKGSLVPGGSLTVMKNAVRVLRPKAVFSVGACSGLDHAKTKLGDVVVSSKLITLVHKTPPSRNISYLIRHAADGWNAPLDDQDSREVKVHCDGDVLSIPEAVSEEIIQQYPEAIAVEREGEGVLSAAHDLNTEWIIVKGIKDYTSANQSSSDEWGVFASVMAASVVAKILSDPVVFQEWPHYNQEACPTNRFDLKTCQRKLAKYYQKTAKVPTSVWSSVYQVNVDKIYTRLSWVKEVKEEQTPAESSRKEMGHYTEMFTEKTKNGTEPNRILVQGETGIGKTTFVKKLLVDLSNLDTEEMEKEQKDALRKFELVLAVNLKDVSKCQTFREVLSHSRLFPEEEETSLDDLYSYILKNQEKVLLVFDGYDEYRTGSEAEEKYGSRSDSPVYRIFDETNLRYCTVMITTRSSRADELRGFADILAEVTGFNLSDRKTFMTKMLKSENEVQDLFKFLEENGMEDLARVPLLNLFFCLLWKKEKEKLMAGTKSKTKLYQKIVRFILQHGHKKSFPSNQVSIVKEEDYVDILAGIGKVALAGLLMGELVFKFGELPETVRGERSVIAGLLQLSEYAPSDEPEETVSFIHKSIQEYLAAWYVTYICVPKGHLGGIKEHPRTLKASIDLENVFQFICGLSDDGVVEVLKHFKSVRNNDSELDLSKTVPDVENDTDGPLCEVTEKHCDFSNLVLRSFRDVHLKNKFFNHFFDCTGDIVLVTEQLIKLLQETKANDLIQTLHSGVVFLVDNKTLTDDCGDSLLYGIADVLDFRNAVMRITESSEHLTLEDFLEDFQMGNWFCCRFNCILCLRNGQFRFYITSLTLSCDYHARLLTETTASYVQPRSASWCSEQSCLRYLRSFQCGIMDQAVFDVLESVSNLRKCSLEVADDGDGDSLADIPLTSASAAKLASLLPRFANVISLHLGLRDCSAAAVETLVTSVIHKTLKELVLNGISLTPGAVAALGRSLSEKPSLETLEITVADGSSLQTEEIEALFGRFMPLQKFAFSGFNVRGCLYPLAKSLHLFPYLKHLELGKVKMHENNLLHAAAAALGRSLAEMSFLETLTLTGVDGSILQAYEIEALFGGFNKALPLERLIFWDFSIKGCLAPLTKSFRFFSNLWYLTLGEVNMDEHNLFHLLQSLAFIPSLMFLKVKCKPHSKSDFCSEKVDAEASFSHKTLWCLELFGISLTPAVAAMLGRSLPEMSSLKILELTGADGRVLQAHEMEALFGRFNKALPLRSLTFSCFSVEGCLAPLTKGFPFFSNLIDLKLAGGVNMNEHNLFHLLQSLAFIPNLSTLEVKCKPHSQSDFCSEKVDAEACFSHKKLSRLELKGISLTPAVALMLGRSLSKMPKLIHLVLARVDGSVLQADEIKALFGRFSET